MRVFFLIISVLCLTFFAQARSLDDIVESKYIVIAVYNDYLPFSANVDGEAIGIDVEIAKEIAASLDVELRLKWMTADESSEDDLRNNLWKGGKYNRRNNTCTFIQYTHNTNASRG